MTVSEYVEKPSYKWLWCKKCDRVEVKVSTEAVAAVCCWCLGSRCDYVPRAQTKPKKPTKVVSNFEKMKKEDEAQKALADSYKQKKQDIKNGVEPPKKKTKRKKRKPRRKKAA